MANGQKYASKPQVRMRFKDILLCGLRFGRLSPNCLAIKADIICIQKV